MDKKSIEEVQDEITEEFAVFSDWTDKYEYLIDLGRSLPLIDPGFKTDEFLVKGCQSRVWLHPDYSDGRIHFTADSDAIITKGIISLLVRVFDDRTPEEILGADMSFLEKIGLKENLSPTRANGLVSMIEKIFAQARELNR